MVDLSVHSDKTLIETVRDTINQLNQLLKEVGTRGIETTIETDHVSRYQVGPAQVPIVRVTVEFAKRL